MKTQKSSDNEDVTPTKKVLKQARLPFMIISDVSPKSVTPPSRKRKLSVPEPEPITKVSKIVNETDLAKDLVVISDDDSKEAPQVEKVDLKLNPYVKLVDTAWKKKAQKAKTSKKKKNEHKNSKLVSNSSTENNENACELFENSDNKGDSGEEMIVDGSEEKTIKMDVDDEKEIQNKNEVKSENIMGKKPQEDSIVTDKDSNCSEDTKQQNHKKSTKLKDSSSVDSDSLNSSFTSAKEEKISQDDKNMTKLENDIEVTPKRSQRNKNKSDEKISNTSLISTCDGSFSSSPSTPRRSNRVSLTNSQGDVSLNDASLKITPKQVCILLYIIIFIKCLLRQNLIHYNDLFVFDIFKTHQIYLECCFLNKYLNINNLSRL